MNHQELLKRVRTIELKTRGLTQQVFSGEYQSAFKGRGMSFSEVRSYQYGDEVRSIDWNVTARFREPFVKVFEEERELTAMMIIDVSGSMYFGKNDESKIATAVEAVATIGFSAAKKRDKVGAIFISDKIERYIPPGKGVKHVYAILNALIFLEPKSKGTDLTFGMNYAVSLMRQRSICFLISDFIDARELKKPLVSAAGKHDFISIQITDQGESELPDLGFIRWRNNETGALTWVDSSSAKVREEYAKNYIEKVQGNEDLFKSLRIDSCVLQGGQPVFFPLMHLFHRRR